MALFSIRRLLTHAAYLLTLAVLPFTTAQAVSYCGAPQVTSLFAGQSINTGSVTITNDATNLYVTYTTTGEWKLQQTHLHAADSLASIPQTKAGNPKVGNFQYQTTHTPPVTEYTYTIAKTALSLDTNQSVVIAAHAVVVKLDGNGYVTVNETGWAAGQPFVERGNWATYVSYAWQTCNNPPPVPQTATETAFAYHGAYAGACFLNLDLNKDGKDDFNRWGWTIGPLAEGNYSFEIYAAAGRCDLRNGSYVGTLMVNYAAGKATVTYDIQGINPMTGVAYNLVEAHLHVGNDILPRDVNGEFTVAPGQYPDIAAELKNVTTKTFEVNGLSGSIYIVAHGTIAGFPLP